MTFDLPMERLAAAGRDAERHLLNQDGLDQAGNKIGLDVPGSNFESIGTAAWFIKGLMSCTRKDIEDIGVCRHWQAINGLIDAVRRERTEQ